MNKLFFITLLAAALGAYSLRIKQTEDYVYTTVKITRGDLSPEQFRGLAAIMRDYTCGYAGTPRVVAQMSLQRWQTCSGMTPARISNANVVQPRQIPKADSSRAAPPSSTSATSAAVQ